MNLVVGDEHTSQPLILMDLNEPGPLNMTPTRQSTETSPIDPNLPFNSGKELKKKKRKRSSEDVEDDPQVMLFAILKDKLNKDEEERAERRARAEEAAERAREAAEREERMVNAILSLTASLRGKPE